METTLAGFCKHLRKMPQEWSHTSFEIAFRRDTPRAGGTESVAETLRS